MADTDGGMHMQDSCGTPIFFPVLLLSIAVAVQAKKLLQHRQQYGHLSGSIATTVPPEQLASDPVQEAYAEVQY